MKLMKPPKLETFSFIFSMPLIALALNLIMYGVRLWHDYRIWVFSFPLIYIMGAVSWYGHVLYSDSVERRYPDLEQSKQRIFRKILISLFVMSPSVVFIFFVYDYFHILDYSVRWIDVGKGLMVGMGVNLVFETLYEADYVFSKFRQSRDEHETMQYLAINNEFDALKNQVNPHFLFNCFNTLSSLISVDKDRAEVFLNELSKVYRYLLRNNQEGVSTLDNEVKFIRSYYKLLQTRHGEAVQMNIQIDKQYHNYLLPSLTLQLLVENVVKHNALSKNKPLIIDVFTAAGNKLVINNNLQRRSVKAPSNNVGLENIKAKYLLLKQPGFQVLEDEKNFTVVLPLIWNHKESQRSGEQLTL